MVFSSARGAAYLLIPERRPAPANCDIIAYFVIE
jgi:hypothetical protein